MFNLTVELLLKESNKEFSNVKQLNSYLDFLCKRYTERVNDYTDFYFDDNQNYKMHCWLHNNTVKWSIDCATYDITLKLAQGVFAYKLIEFQSYQFEVTSMNMKKLDKASFSEDSLSLALL